MRMVYPVVFTKVEDGYIAHVPDFDIDTQGADLPEAIAMARDAIGIMGIDMEDDKKVLPDASPLDSVTYAVDELVSMVDIDFGEYRRANDRRTVRRNVSLPSWLDTAAIKAGVNVSAILQTALKQVLDVPDRG